MSYRLLSPLLCTFTLLTGCEYHFSTLSELNFLILDEYGSPQVSLSGTPCVEIKGREWSRTICAQESVSDGRGRIEVSIQDQIKDQRQLRGRKWINYVQPYLVVGHLTLHGERVALNGVISSEVTTELLSEYVEIVLTIDNMSRELLDYIQQANAAHGFLKNQILLSAVEDHSERMGVEHVKTLAGFTTDSDARDHLLSFFAYEQMSHPNLETGDIMALAREISQGEIKDAMLVDYVDARDDLSADDISRIAQGAYADSARNHILYSSVDFFRFRRVTLQTQNQLGETVDVPGHPDLCVLMKLPGSDGDRYCFEEVERRHGSLTVSMDPDLRVEILSGFTPDQEIGSIQFYLRIGPIAFYGNELWHIHDGEGQEVANVVHTIPVDEVGLLLAGIVEQAMVAAPGTLKNQILLNAARFYEEQFLVAHILALTEIADDGYGDRIMVMYALRRAAKLSVDEVVELALNASRDEERDRILSDYADIRAFSLGVQDIAKLANGAVSEATRAYISSLFPMQ